MLTRMAITALTVAIASGWTADDVSAIDPGTDGVSWIASGPFCGDGIADLGEDCENCPDDVKCPPGEECIAGVCRP